MSAQPVPYITVKQYLEIEREAEYKSEYFQGMMWPLGGVPHGMAGGRMQHGRIAVNLAAELRAALRGRCSVLNSDMRIHVGPDGLYTYPDVSVVCGPPEVTDDETTLLNPTMIVEVLSKSTEALDRGFKFWQYRSISTLREYVLVSQVKPSVEVFRRMDSGDWIVQPYTGLESQARFASVGCDILLREIYLDVEFADYPRPPK